MIVSDTILPTDVGEVARRAGGSMGLSKMADPSVGFADTSPSFAWEGKLPGDD